MSDRIAEIRARLEGLYTYGPWKVYRQEHELSEAGVKEFGPDWKPPHSNCIGTKYDHPQLKGPSPVVTVGNSPFRVQQYAVWIADADAEFIAHAPADIEWLLAELERIAGGTP